MLTVRVRLPGQSAPQEFLLSPTDSIGELCRRVAEEVGAAKTTTVSILSGYPPKPLDPDERAGVRLKNGEVVVARIQGATDHVKQAEHTPAPPAIIHVTDLRGLTAVLQAHRSVVVDFYAAWCGPCKMLQPILEDLCQRFPSVTFVKVDVDVAMDAAQAFKVTAMPTVVFFKSNKEVDRVVGADSDKIRRVVSSL